jgi:hypothetical protein
MSHGSFKTDFSGGVVNEPKPQITLKKLVRQLFGQSFRSLMFGRLSLSVRV